jgi:hypothetical protein
MRPHTSSANYKARLADARLAVDLLSSRAIFSSLQREFDLRLCKLRVLSSGHKRKCEFKLIWADHSRVE